MPSIEKFFVGGDFNGHIGSLARGYDDVHGGFGFDELNEGGASLLDFTRVFWVDGSEFKLSEEGRTPYYLS